MHVLLITKHRESLPGQREHPWTVLSEVAKRKEARGKGAKGIDVSSWRAG